MAKEWFYTITKWMQELGLKGTELNLYAIIFGYSQEADGCFYGTRGTLAKRCGVSSIRTIDAALESLIRKGLIEKRVLAQGPQNIIGYSVCANSARGVQKLHTPPMQNLHGGCAEIAPIKNKEENKILENIPPFPPTVKEVADYCRAQGFADPEGFADYYVRYQTENGWMTGKGKNRKPIDNWKLNVVTWGRYHKNETFITARAEQPATQISKENLKDYLR